MPTASIWYNGQEANITDIYMFIYNTPKCIYNNPMKKFSFLYIKTSSECPHNYAMIIHDMMAMYDVVQIKFNNKTDMISWIHLYQSIIVKAMFI